MEMSLGEPPVGSSPKHTGDFQSFDAFSSVSFIPSFSTFIVSGVVCDANHRLLYAVNHLATFAMNAALVASQ